MGQYYSALHKGDVNALETVWPGGVHVELTGDSVTAVLASVVKDDPDLSRVPPQIRRLLQACLQKDPKNRLRDVGDAWQLMEEHPGPLADVPPPARRR